MKTTVATIEHDGVELSLVVVNGGLRVAAEGLDLGPVRGVKRLAGPQLAASDGGTKAVYRALAGSAGYRSYLATIL